MQHISKPDVSPACPCCDAAAESAIDRRRFLRVAGGAALAAGVASVPGLALARGPRIEVRSAGALATAPAADKTAEDFVKLFYEGLKAEQRQAICFPFDHPLRTKVNNNWHIVPQKVGEFLSSDQQELVRQILRGITTEDGFERFSKSMKDDAGGLGDYSAAVFGDPTKGERFQWVLTGRHVTLRADGNTTANTAFGGPIFYGHAVTGTERPDHPGNVWWHQGLAANEVFKSLDGKQREKALLPQSPPDSPETVQFRGAAKHIPGLAGAELSKDQKALLEKTLKSLLSMFREADVNEMMECLKKNGGLDQAHIAFYGGKDNDLGEDGVWDRWRVEGPTFVWYFRGSPHVHTWVNVGHEGPKWL
jgi:hypothetical protein